jgi:heme exporter protein CcmD
MMDWLQNPHADYVLAAYGVALTGMVGFLFLSWRWLRTQNKKLRQLEQSRK